MRINHLLLNPVTFIRIFFLVLSLTVGGFIFGSFGIANAGIISSSSAFGESVDLELLPPLRNGIEVLSGPLPLVSGSAPPAYIKSNSLATVTVSAALLGQILKTDVLTVNAASSVPGSTTTSADATVNKLELDVISSLVLNLLSIDASIIRSSASIGGTCGALTSKGTTTIVGAVLGGQLGVGKTITLNPAPNTVLINALGIRVVLNEQIVTSSATTRNLTVNAIHISFDNTPLNIGLLNGDIIISQSHVQLACVPGKADLSLTKTARPNPVKVGQYLTYTLTVTNNGPDKATQVSLNDTLPEGADFISAAANQGTCIKSGARNVICNLGILKTGAVVETKITVKITKVINTAAVKGFETDPNTVNNKAQAVSTLY
jgi:uncharacterized repeat protein (TIGR01451 family)